MISATVASPRRWRMSITWRSRRESVAASGSGVMTRDVWSVRAALDARAGTVEKSAVLIFQQPGGFVKREFLVRVTGPHAWAATHAWLATQSKGILMRRMAARMR